MPIDIVTGAAAQQNAAGLPINVLLYGQPGTLKTTDAVSTFMRPDGSCSAFVIPCEDGALKTIAKRGWPVPDHTKQPVKSWGAMVDAFSWLWAHKGNYNAVIIDGFSAFASYIYKEADEQHKGNKNKFLVPVTVRNNLFQLREGLRTLGLHSVLTAHPLAPGVVEGVFYPGGFMLSPKSVVPEFFGQIDTVLRTDYLQIPGRAPVRVYYTGGEEWPAELGTLGQPPDWRLWRTKNREGVNQAVVPADLRALLSSGKLQYAGF